MLTPGNPKTTGTLIHWRTDQDYWINVDNDEVAGADNTITVFIDCNIVDQDGKLLGVVGVGLRIRSRRR